MKRLAISVCLSLLAASAALAWWDTQVRAQKPLPLVKAFQAAELNGAADRRPDPQANGGRGGDAAYVKPGSALTFSADLKRSVYAVWMIARADEKEFAPPADPDQEIELPGGKVKVRYPRRPVYVTLSVKSSDGKEQQWYMPITYRTEYNVVSSMSFPLHVDGPCQIAMGLDPRSAIGLLVNRLEVRDALGNCARVAAKTRRMLTSDEELAKVRADFAEKNPNRRAVQRPEEERARRNESLWAALPPINIMTADPLHNRWNNVLRALEQSAKTYEQTTDPEAGWDGAIALCAFAEKYPALDHFYSEVSPYGPFSGAGPRTWGSRPGKTVYSGWEGPALMSYAASYDRLFDFIKDNQPLADFVQTRIPWVKTPKDVIELIDTNLLQHGVDCLNRRVIRSDEAAAFVPLVQGVNDVARDMLAGGLFTKTHFNMSDMGGLDDQVFTSYSRGGVHYIGATGYVGSALTEIADYLSRYRAAGGDARFDISNPKLYPHMAEAEVTKRGLHAAGGFPIIVGDSMDLRRGRTAEAPMPARVLEGFGEVVLEDGQDEPTPLRKRAAAVHTGIGRGHAHQDTLNLEAFAHGCRLAPDLGGRHEGANHAVPNMRINRMHNLVEVDERNFENTYPGSTVSATGWTVSFSPQPGAQYAANAARATSHPYVSLYHRATAMIDGRPRPDGSDVYLFDVFRVVGGKVHTYCFHGAITEGEKIEANAPLKPAAGAEAVAYLAQRPENSRLEGVAPDPLVATWMLDPKLQKSYQGSSYDAQRPVGITLMLFGRSGDSVLVGSAVSQVYPVAMPYLHVQARQPADGRVSVYPALYECHAAGRFIQEARRLGVAPDAADGRQGVALAVNLGGDRKDLAFSSLRPETLHKIDDGTQVAGEFAFLSEDARGLRLLHLVGGTQLSRGPVGVRCDKPAYEARIEKVDYPSQELTLDADLPPRLLDGQVALIGNDRHPAEFRLTTVDGRKAVVAHTPKYYQSQVVHVDPAGRLVDTELEPMVYGSDMKHCDGTTVTNEAMTRSWRATLQPRERWMYLGWPGTDLSYPREVRMEDLPDADGDGKRTLKLLGAGDDKDAQGNPAAGKPVLTLEVTRVDPAENLFYFKMPENPAYQLGGWQYANRVLVNEDGSKKWWATYPGTTFAWQLEGPDPVRDEDFADADKDGKRKLFAFHFGPGDAVSVKTFVHVRRLEDGAYEVRANTPCTLTLPGVGKTFIAAGGSGMAGVETRKVEGGVEVKLTAEELAAGVVRVQVRLGE